MRSWVFTLQEVAQQTKTKEKKWDQYELPHVPLSTNSPCIESDPGTDAIRHVFPRQKDEQAVDLLH